MKNTLFSLFALTAALSAQPAMAQDPLALFKSKPCAACPYNAHPCSPI